MSEKQSRRRSRANTMAAGEDKETVEAWVSWKCKRNKEVDDGSTEQMKKV